MKEKNNNRKKKKKKNPHDSIKHIAEQFRKLNYLNR